MKKYEVLWRTKSDTLPEVEYVSASSHTWVVVKVLDESGFRPEQVEIIRVEEVQ